jgi:phospholipid/cholesterol/gamma-HCH transport system permease protein
LSAAGETLAGLGAGALSGLRWLGATSLLGVRTLLLPWRVDGRELLRQCALFGLGSLPLALGSAVLIGATVILQTRVYAERFGARTLLGWAAGYAALWEFGPLLLGLVLSARLGARNAAELAVMQTGGKLEGLRGVALDPERLIVGPRIWAIVLSVLALCMPVFLVSLVCEAVAARLVLGLPLEVFAQGLGHPLGGTDLVGGALKCLAFAVAIALVSSVAGLSARGGARGVGRAAASAVVSASGSIFALDWLLTRLLAGWTA